MGWEISTEKGISWLSLEKYEYKIRKIEKKGKHMVNIIC